MLSQRKRFNYLNGLPRESSVKKPLVSSTVKYAPLQFENPQPNIVRQNKQNPKKMQKLTYIREQLELINKKMLDETAKQFKKLQTDIQRVQGILEQKENQTQQLQKHSSQLEGELVTVRDQKKILIQAILEKDIVIREYEAKIKQLLKQKQESIPQEEAVSVRQTVETSVQTEQKVNVISEGQFVASKTMVLGLQDELFRLKEELFDAQTKVKLQAQQFEAYKILREIQSVQLI